MDWVDMFSDQTDINFSVPLSSSGCQKNGHDDSTHKNCPMIEQESPTLQTVSQLRPVT